MIKTIQLTISDETLRDGEQQAGLFFEDETKRVLAQLIAQTGVQQIAIMPAVHVSESHLVKTLVKEKWGHKIVASTMMGEGFIDQSQDCGAKHIILFYAISDRLLSLRNSGVHTRLKGNGHVEGESRIPCATMAKIRQQMKLTVLKHLQYAAAKGLKIDFAAEDASRADFEFLVECIQAFSPYLTRFMLCDTVGILTPERTYQWIQKLREQVGDIPLTIHCHNDMGLALENTIQAILAGVSGISGTFGGIGERAGNVALEQVLNGLQLRFGWKVAGIDYSALERVTTYLDRLGVAAHPPYSKLAQCYETGIHVHSLLRDRSSYYIFPYGEPEIWFSKYSGLSNFHYLFEKLLGHPLTKNQYEQLRFDIKALSIREQRSFSTEDVLTMLDQGMLKIPADDPEII